MACEPTTNRLTAYPLAKKFGGLRTRITATYAERILSVDLAVARLWGSFGVPDPIPTLDGLLAATAIHHELVLVTRNVKDVARTGVEYINPFEPGAA